MVEDKAVQAQALGVVLCHDGYAVETATTGAEALERAHGVTAASRMTGSPGASQSGAADRVPSPPPPPVSPARPPRPR